MGLGGGGSGDLEIKVVATGIDTTTKQIDDLDKKLSGVGKTSEGAAGGVDGFSSKLIAAGLGAVSFGAAMATLNSTLDNALRVENLTAGFNNLQASIGNDAVSKMTALQDATGGLISKMDLMQSANQAVLLGVDDGTGKFEQLAGASLKLGAAMGITAKEALDSLVVGIGRGSKLVLDNLGIMVNSEQAYKDYAKSINVTVDALTDSQKKLAFQKAAFEAANESAAALAEPADTAAGAYARFKVSIGELIDQMSVAISDSDRLKTAINLGTEAVEAAPSAWERFKSVLSTVGEYIDAIENSFSMFIATSGAKWNAFVSLLGEFKFPSPAAVDQRAKESLDKMFAEQEAFKVKWSQTLAIGKAPVGALDIFGGDFTQEIQKGSLALAKLSDGLSGGGGGGGSSVEDAAKKAKLAMDSLLKSVAELRSNKELDFLKKELKLAIELKAPTEALRALSVSIYETVKEANERAFIAAGGRMNEAAMAAIDEKSKYETAKIEASIIEGTKKGTDKAKTFFESIVNELGIDLFDTSSEFGANLALQVENSLAGAIKSAFNSGDIGKAIEGLATSVAGALGTAVAGPIGGAIAEIGAQSAINIGKSVAKGDKISDRDNLMVGGVNGLIYNEVIGEGMFRGKGSEGKRARSQIESWLEETLGKNVEFDNFTNNFRDTFSNVTGEAQGAFETIGEAIKGLVGVTTDVGDQIGYILSDNFGGTIDDLKYVVSDLGITFEQVQDQMVQAFLAGEQSATQVVGALAGIEEAFKPGLAGAGQFTAAMDNLIGSMGMGRDSLKSLRDLAVEFKETGGKSLAEFQVALENSGKYTSAQISSLFQALANKGITSLDQLSGASDIALIGVLSDLESLGFEFNESFGRSIKDSIKYINDFKKVLSDLPETTEKNLKINVSTNYTDPQAKGALQQLPGGPGLARA